MPQAQPIMLLTGASRGIGHATVKLFQERGWRILTVSRQPFSEECRWPGAREGHVQADLAELDRLDSLAAEVRRRLPDGALHAIAPGEIDTAILSSGTEDIIERDVPMRRLGDAREVAETIHFLCTAQSSYINGAEIHINGGQHV